MMKFEEIIDFDYLIKKAVNEKCEITVTASLENLEIRIEPWKPFEYKCPYSTDTLGNTNEKPGYQ